MKFAYVLSAGLLAAVVSAGAASAANYGYSSEEDVLDGTMAIFSYLMTNETSDSQDIGDVVVEQPSVVPLPAAGWLLLAGVAGLAAVRRRKSA